MAREFPGEVARSAKRLGVRRVKPTAEPLTRTPPRARSKNAVKPKKESARPELGQLLSDLRSGVSRLGQLTGQLAASKQRAGMPQTSTARRPSAEVTKLIERELRTLTKLVPGASTEVIKEYRQLAERATKLHIPQAHAAILEGERRLKPAEVMRPTSKAVRSLMRAAAAIKQGRLPFLPKETRREAHRLLQTLFNKQTAVNIAKSARIPKVVEAQRLIPQAVQGLAMAGREPDSPIPPLVQAIRKAVEAPLTAMQGVHKLGITSADAPAPRRAGPAPGMPDLQGRTPIAAEDMPRLAKELPSFDREGLAVGGEFRGHAGEDVVAIGRSDSANLAPGDDATAAASDLTPMPRANSSRTPSTTPADGAPARATGGAAPAGAGNRQGAGKTQVEGTLSIPELGNAIAKFTGFMTDNGALT